MARARKSDSLTPAPPTQVRGNIDRISTDGVLFGWCLDEGAPGRRLYVTIFGDGEPLGIATASNFRQDLMDAGVGDGQHGFNFTLPIQILRQQRTCFISATHPESGVALGGSLTWRADAAVAFDDRLAKIESDLASLNGRMQTTMSNDGAIAALFDAVGMFFARLGQDLRDGKPSDDGLGLASRVDLLSATYADIILPIPLTPRLAILLTAGSAIDVLHATLAVIAASPWCRCADVFVLDDQSDDQVALLPAVVRNLRYIRLRSDPVGERRALLATLDHEVIIFIDTRVGLAAGWLDGLVDTLLSRENVGLCGLPSAADPLAGAVFAKNCPGDTGVSLRDVDAWGFAVRNAALMEAGGIDASYDSFDVGVTDLCYRIRAAGWTVDGYLPTPASQTSHVPDASVAYARSIAVLKQRWPILSGPEAGAAAAVCLVNDQSKSAPLSELIRLIRLAALEPLLIVTAPRGAAAALESALLQLQVETIWSGDAADILNALLESGTAIELICVPTADDISPVAAVSAASGLKIHVKAVPEMLDWLRGPDASPARAQVESRESS